MYADLRFVGAFFFVGHELRYIGYVARISLFFSINCLDFLATKSQPTLRRFHFKGSNPRSLIVTNMKLGAV